MRCCKGDEVARALLFLVVRVANTWRSIRTLRNHTPDGEGFAVDAGTLLRAMFDAYLQAEYIVQDPQAANALARDYLDFAHVERFKLARAVTSHDNPLSIHVKSSPDRPEGEKRLQTQFDRVKARYIVEKKGAGGAVKRGPKTRNAWYVGSLAEIARLLGKVEEYEILLSNFHGCVHSSSFAVERGPMVSPGHVVDWASTIAARVTRLNVNHHKIVFHEFYGTILEALCKPYF